MEPTCESTIVLVAQIHNAIAILGGDESAPGINIGRPDPETAIKRELDDRVETLCIRLLVDGEADNTFFDEAQRFGRQIKSCSRVIGCRKVLLQNEPRGFGVGLAGRGPL